MKARCADIETELLRNGAIANLQTIISERRLSEFSGLPYNSMMVPNLTWSTQVRRKVSPARTSQLGFVKWIASHRRANATITSKSTISGVAHRELIMVAVFRSAINHSFRARRTEEMGLPSSCRVQVNDDGTSLRGIKGCSAPNPPFCMTYSLYGFLTVCWSRNYNLQESNSMGATVGGHLGQGMMFGYKLRGPSSPKSNMFQRTGVLLSSSGFALSHDCFVNCRVKEDGHYLGGFQR